MDFDLVKRVLAALEARGVKYAIFGAVALNLHGVVRNTEDLLGDCPAVRYTPPAGSFYIDILTRLGEAFRFADLETERLPYDELTVTVVTPAATDLRPGARLMPVQKFRSVADMPDPPRRLPGDPALYRAIAGIWEFGRRANPRRFPPGVRKFRSVEDMS